MRDPAGADAVVLRPLDRAFLARCIDDLVALDAAVRAELGDAYSHEAWGRDEFLAERPSKWRFSIAALGGDRLVGFLIASRDGETGHMHRLAVTPARRHRGIAHLLVGAAESAVRAGGLCTLRLSVGADNAAALAFWMDLGYRALDAAGHRAYAAARGLDSVGDAVRAGGRPYRILEKRLEVECFGRAN
ncbi:MAG TPA: GNAT family N-acetyltransferase [Longimicrobiales bacterium]